MDIRNIKTPAPEVKNGEYLEMMYNLQKQLMEGYIRIEGLPQYPLNINNKKAQIVLKDFSARVTEELAEGYESTHIAIDMLKKVGFNTSKLTNNEFNMLLNHLQNSNEEQADATAFFIELMIYADINPSDIFALIREENLLPDDVVEYYQHEPEGLLEALMIIGVVLLNRNNKNLLELPLRFRVIDREDFETKEKYEEVSGYIPAFQELSDIYHEVEPIMLWDVCYHLGVARNYLKNKPWKQSGELTDERPFVKEVILGFIKYMGYLSYMGFTPQSLYNLFWRKNQVNIFRQKSRY